MKAILETALVIAMLAAFAVILCALIGAVWFAIQPNHEADNTAARDPFDLDREFRDPDIGCNPAIAGLPLSAQDARAASSLECGGSTPLSLSTPAKTHTF